MRAFIDCEFDGSHGELISMGIISEDGLRVFYEVVEHSPPNPWVQENVIPILNKQSITLTAFKDRLMKFLECLPKLTLIADHAADLYYFTQVIMGKDGWMMVNYPLELVVDPAISAKKSTLLHNALEDAKALRIDWLRVNGYL